MKKTLCSICLGVACSALVISAVSCDPNVVEVDVTEDASADYVFDKAKDAINDKNYKDLSAYDATFNLWPPSSGPIVRRTGPVMLDVPNVYIIWYGDWTQSKAKTIVPAFLNEIDGSDWLMISADYWMSNWVIDNGMSQTRPRFVSGRINVAQSIDVGYMRGKSLGIDGVKFIVHDVISQSKLPSDENGIYYVLTSADVTEGAWSGFCTYYCGWHDHQDVNGANIKFSFVGDPGLQCLDGCTLHERYLARGADHSPNYDWGADAMLSVIAHELTEAITDPDLNAWYDQELYENADMCAWRFEPAYKTDTGSYANVHMGTHDYLIQENWVLDGDAGHCALRK